MRRKASDDKRPLRLEWIEAGSLAENPDNWRRHPEGQTSALKAVMSEVGWAGALLYNETTSRLIDGHARKAAVAPTDLVPVLVGRWSPEQEMKILATLDPLAAMALPDADALETLLAEIDLDGAEYTDLSATLERLVELGERIDEMPAAGDEDEGDAGERKRGPRTMRFVCGQFTFDVPRQAYDTWLSAVEGKAGTDPDQVIKELKRRLRLGAG